MHTDAIQLKWQTSDEVNIRYFTVERSGDGAHFSELEKVQATGHAVNSYSVTDPMTLQGVSYYRLQITDNDGVTRYSNIISCRKEPGIGLEVYPRLITGVNSVLVTCSPPRQNALVQVMDINGRVLQSKKISRNESQTHVDVSKLAKGSYLVVFISDGKRATQLVLKQ
jgi:hypothetical protein